MVQLSHPHGGHRSHLGTRCHEATSLSLRALRRGHDDDAQVAAWSEGGDDLLQVLRGVTRHQGAHRHGYRLVWG